ncbi:hypothetical protein [Piscirickettsia litoralis]|uniref:Bacteriophage lambda Replication protein O N-terminal domain-containing protein n=1 Tax=Piscirickettsia litoralis TaxID=1891921 RepID=A0ABX3A0V2_9GAMM|nr:hypothetical protein [Piscirickettsia litoralis]ODN41258.1 hypothetical protein BGC07_16940 [Piscirickettsia litoralis]
MKLTAKTKQNCTQPVNIPEERLLVIQPFHLELCNHNVCAAMILSLCIDRHNRFGWSEHHVTQKDLRHNIFNMYGEKSGRLAFNLLLENKLILPIQKKYPGRQQPFTINAALINKRLSDYQSQYPLNDTHRRVSPNIEHQEITDKKSCLTSKTAVTKQSFSHSLYKEIDKENKKEVLSNNTHAPIHNKKFESTESMESNLELIPTQDQQKFFCSEN